MRFSLKTMLIGLTVAGALTAWMGRLWVENPEMFFQVLAIATTVGPFVLAMATIIWLGWRGSKPSRRLIAWGVLLLITPFLGQVASGLLLPSGQPIRVLSTARLIGNRLPQQVDEPWVWNELEYRLTSGELSQEEVGQAVQELTAHMEKTRPQGWNQPLTWQRKFLVAARQQGLISQEVLVRLCEAFYGTRPTFKPFDPLQPGPCTIMLELKYGNPWAQSASLGVTAVWHVNSVTVDGQPAHLTFSQMSTGQDWNAACKVDLDAGDHELLIEVECALVDDSKLLSVDVNTATPDQWPAALKRWKVEVKAPLRVQSEGEADE